ncbi:OPT oligopeptide transporter protein-domain-containing protein [Stachybotrys elegans]|uniref:OPT oligopeptide transporter protein-domain-containing protein n=1 Tax=Stachybotrys elegans TaxID=80388 RepID=A0A8K0SJJ3_9HYPO|nr:OPT oligopeptide transporter protein-domain-containing protein [Stachybotrys elegans]
MANADQLRVGSVIGAIVCLTNVHCGLQTGYTNLMQMPSALLGFAIMKLLTKQTSLAFDANDNILIQTISTSIGMMPSAAGLVGVIPALEYLLQKPVHIPYGKLVAWSVGVSLFGLAFAAMMRWRIIKDQDLRFPTGAASALLLNVLHGPEKTTRALETTSEEHQSNDEPRRVQNGHDSHIEEVHLDSSLTLLSLAVGISIVYTIVTWFFPILKDLPVIGRAAASQLWTVNLSPGYFGQGIITGPTAVLNMLAGAIVGWGILSPVAKSRGWAPGDPGDWDTGSRGWILWVGLAIMLADSLVCLMAFTLKSIWPSTGKPEANPAARLEDADNKQTWRGHLTIGLIISALCCLASVKIGFGSNVSTLTTVVAVGAAIPLCLVGINAIGSTDYNPSSGIARISQLLIGAIFHRGGSRALAENLVAGGVAEAGVVTAGFMMQTFKTASIVGANPFVQLMGMVYGTIVGGAVASSLYKLYARVYTIPGDVFGMPSAFAWRDGARLAIGQQLPPHVAEVGLAMGVCFAAFAALRLRYSGHTLSVFIPSGVPFAVGMYLTPSFTLIRVAGALVVFYWARDVRRSQASLYVFASGLMLGEGIGSMASLILEASRFR